MKGWDFDQAAAKIKHFVEALQSEGWYLEVFIDAGIQSEEGWDKWKGRRVKEVESEQRNIPQGMTDLMGEMYRELGVKVHFSVVDNDDTLAAYAYRDGAAILS